MGVAAGGISGREEGDLNVDDEEEEEEEKEGVCDSGVDDGNLDEEGR